MRISIGSNITIHHHMLFVLHLLCSFGFKQVFCCAASLMNLLQLFLPLQTNTQMNGVCFLPNKWDQSGHPRILNTQYLILRAIQNETLCFGVFFIMMMMTPFENGWPLNELQELCTTYKSYYRFAMTEEGGRSCGHPDTDLLYSYDTFMLPYY